MKRLFVAVVCMSWVVSCSRQEAVDWSRKPLIETDGSIGGKAFSINLPRGLTETKEASSVSWSASDPGAGAPRVHLAIEDGPAPRTVAQAVERALASAEGHEVHREDTIGHGHLVVLRDPDRATVLALTYRRFDETRTLTCRATATGVGEAFESKASWIANMCLTLAVVTPR